MSIISQETWDNMPNEEKEKLKKYLNDNSESFHIKHIINSIFGEGKFQPEPKIKTWEDVDDNIKNIIKIDGFDAVFREILHIDISTAHLSNSVAYRIVASVKIRKLIELGYGGTLSNGEWKNPIVEKFKIVPNKNGDFEVVRCYNIKHKDIVAFKTREMSENFLKYEDNLNLLKMYYMI